MSNVKANTEKPKRDKYTWLTVMLFCWEVWSVGCRHGSITYGFIG